MWFDETVPLPPGFGGVPAIRRAIEYMERELADLVEIYYEQANVFSALVGISEPKPSIRSATGKRTDTRILPSKDSQICVARAAAIRLVQMNVWRVKPVRESGRFSPIMTIPAGTSFGEPR